MKNLIPVVVALQSLGVLGAGGLLTAQTLGGRPASPVASAKAVPEHAKAVEPKIDPRGVVSELLDGNERFARGVAKHRDLLVDRNALISAQHPKAIVLSCSDSRVPPELVFDETVGGLFVVRSAGNVADKIGLASMEYAAEHLHVPVLLVLGHEKCGAVTAASTGDKMPTENLQALVDEIAPGLARLKARYQGPELVHHGVEANVTATANEVIERSPLLRKAVEEGHLLVVRAVYSLDDGRVRWLDAEDLRPTAAAAKTPEKALPATPESPAPAPSPAPGAKTPAAHPGH